MASHFRTAGCHRIMMRVTLFYLQPDISEHTPTYLLTYLATLSRLRASSTDDADGLVRPIHEVGRVL